MAHWTKLLPTTIRPALEILASAWQTRRAWWFTATARTRARFVRTTLGSFWLGFSNLLSIMALAAVYGTVLKVSDPSEYVIYIGTGLVIWSGLASSIGAAPLLFEYNSSHLRNTNLHPVFYTLEEWSFQLQTFLQSFALVLTVLSLYRPSLIVNMLTTGWLPLLNMLIFIYWLPLLLCMLGIRFQDLFQLVPVLLQLVFLLSPILYYKESLGRFGWVAELNPLYRVLSPFRHTLLYGEVQWNQSIALLAFNATGLIIALLLLARNRRDLPFLV